MLNGSSVSRSEVDEMEEVLYSVSYGQKETHKKATYQAFSAVVSQQYHIDLVMRYICLKEKNS